MEKERGDPEMYTNVTLRDTFQLVIFITVGETERLLCSVVAIKKLYYEQEDSFSCL